MVVACTCKVEVPWGIEWVLSGCVGGGCWVSFFYVKFTGVKV